MSTDLPPGWTWATPDELSAKTPNALTIGPFGSDLKVPDYTDRGVPLVFVREIRAQRFGDERTKFVSEEKAHRLARHYVRPGDLLVTKMGDPPGDTAVYPADRPPAIITADCIKLTPNTTVTSAEYLRDCFRAEPVRSQVLEQTAGVAQQKLSLERFRTVKIPLPPLGEQARIVRKLEVIHARRSRAREALDAVPPLLEKLRQSFLAAAFRGDLTKDWRAKNKNVEPATDLLARIRSERRKKWEEAEVEKIKARGKPPADERWKANYVEAAPVNTAELARLPDGWCWASLGELLAEGLANGRSVRTDDGGFPVLRLTALRHEIVDIRERKGGAWSAAEAAPFLVHKGDFLVSRGNGSLGLVGRGGLVAEEPDGVAYPDTLIRMRFHSLVDRAYLVRVWSSRLVRRQIERAAKTTAGIYKVNQGDLESIAIPVPEIREQARIALAIDDKLQRMRELENLLDVQRSRASALDRALLARAFRGELVPQDPQDEHADAMAPRSPADGTTGDAPPVSAKQATGSNRKTG